MSIKFLLELLKFVEVRESFWTEGELALFIFS